MQSEKMHNHYPICLGVLDSKTKHSFLDGIEVEKGLKGKVHDDASGIQEDHQSCYWNKQWRTICIVLGCTVLIVVAIALVFMAMTMMWICESINLQYAAMDSGTVLKSHELTLRSGDTVDCGEANWLKIKEWYVQEKVLARYGDHEAEIWLKRVGKSELEGLKEKRTVRFSDKNFTVTSETRFTIPRGYYQLPYLMTGSNITVSICLHSNHTIKYIPNNARLYIFNGSSTVFNFLNNKTNSTHNAVFNTPLEVGTNVNLPKCYRRVYTMPESGYYRVALDVPIGVTVVQNIALEVAYVNGSKLTNVEPCVVERHKTCLVGLKLQTEPQTLLCYTPTITSMPYLYHTTHVVVTEIPHLENFYLMSES